MQNKFHNPTSRIQRASHISRDLSYSPEIILVSHNHTSNTPYVHFGYPSFEKLINVTLRCNCISSRNNSRQHFVPGKASIGTANNTSTLFSSRRMRPIQEPRQSRRGSHCPRALGTAHGGTSMWGLCGPGTAQPLFIHTTPPRQRKSKLPGMLPLPELPEPAVQALEVGASTALCTHPALVLLSKAESWTDTGTW